MYKKITQTESTTNLNGLVFSTPFLNLLDLIGGAFFFKGGYLFLGIGKDEEAEGVQLRGQDL